ncbi:MAG: nucleotidyltransferase domain-containing protein [Candidatus Jordarchaeales archaeon]
MSVRGVALSEEHRTKLASYLLRKLSVTRVYLFGSRVYVVPFEDSDLDIIAASEEFGKRCFIENNVAAQRTVGWIIHDRSPLNPPNK